MTMLRELDQQQSLADPLQRQHYVTVMFDEIAPRYDRFTRWFSYGMDRPWKEELIRGVRTSLPPQRDDSAGLDLACGTGDLARGLADACPHLTVTAVDISVAMIAAARPHPRVRFQVADATRLGVENQSIEAITVGYGLRNFPDHRAAIAEMHRVLKPGGILGILEFTRPRWLLWRWIFLSYLWLAGMLYGWWWHRHGQVYGYIAHSIAMFTTRHELIEDLHAAGFEMVQQRSRLGGGMAILVARKCR